MALPEPSPKEGQNNKPIDQDDKDFDPTPEALIDEIDDERTLEEEEALDGNNGTAVQEELDDLKKESEMPIEELLAYYERMRNESQVVSEFDENEEEDEEDEEEEDDDDELDENEVDENAKSKKKIESLPTESNKLHDDTSTLPQQTHSQSAEENEPVKGRENPKSSNQQHTQTQTQTQRHRHPPHCGIMDSDAHSTTTSNPVSDESRHQHQQQRRPHQANVSNQTEQSQLGYDSIDNAQERSKHPMTDFIIDDEAGGMFKSLFGYDLDDSDDLDEDYSYTDDENGNDERDWRKSIQIGQDYQADVPEGLCYYDDLPPYENQDKLIWKINPELSADQLLDFLNRASLLSKRNDLSISSASVPKISYDNMRIYRERMQDITSSTGSHATEQNHDNMTSHDQPRNLLDAYISQSRKRARIDYEIEQENVIDGINQASGLANNQLTGSNKDENSDSTSQDLKPELSTDEYFQDEEQLLFLLLQCNYNLEEAFRRRKLDPLKYYFHEPMSLWSQDECLGFEHGLRLYGKNFRLIRENKVQTRTHAELVAFYYLWKKSERHDVYTNQYKLDRKRCLSHPGTTDYMDKFIEDNESILNASSSSTPTPTESAASASLHADSINENNTSALLCHSSESKPPVIQYINAPQGSAMQSMQRSHLHLHHPKSNDDSAPNNSVYVDNNTPH